MYNISEKGDSIHLNKGEYIIIDGLYLNDIKIYFESTELGAISIEDFKKKIFPYNSIPFSIAKFSSDYIFNISQLQKVNYNEISDSYEKYLSTDTGLLIFINKNILQEFIVDYDFDKLVDYSSLNYQYWSSLYKKFNNKNIGLILSPGLHSEYEFNGSGVYKVEV